jgi:peptidoglycan/LPS O-acetylase OafA/YrhL
VPNQKHLQKLDDIRGFAAIYVIIHHLVNPFKFIPSPIQFIFSFGQEAVILFFLLSGFVIYTSCSRYPKLDFRNYFLRRWRRIYFPFFIAILISIFVYAFNGDLTRYFSWQNLLGNIFMLQDIHIVKPGIGIHCFLGNYPLWSLSYEWWFYMLFFWLYNQKNFFRYKFKLYVIFSVSILSLIVYNILPNQLALFLAYFVIWWAGLAAAEIYQREGHFSYRNLKHVLICLFFMALVTALNTYVIGFKGLGYYPFLLFRHFAFAFLIVIFGLIWYRYKLIYFQQTVGIFGAITPISYGLYIFHFPLLEQWNLNPYIPNIFLQYLLKFTVIFALAYLVEIKLQPQINKLLK